MGSSSFIPYLIEDEQAGVVVVGLMCTACERTFDSADVMMDSLMFKEASVHWCTISASPNFRQNTATSS